MPLCHKIINENFILGLWDLVEPEIQLYQEFESIAPEKEIIRANIFKNPNRKMEWMASRLLLYQLLNQVVEIEYDLNRKPSILNHQWEISISHTRGLVAVIVAKSLAGIDVELISERVLKIEDRFLSAIEKNQLSPENRLNSVLISWSAKETLYKIYGEKALDFKRDMYINPFYPLQKGKLSGEIKTQKKTEILELDYFVFKKDNSEMAYIVVYHYA